MLEDSTIYIVAQSDSISESVLSQGERCSKDIGGGWDTEPIQTISETGKRKRVAIDALALKAQMGSLLKVMGELFSQADQQTGMILNEVELSVEINAEGQVSLVGNGVKLGNNGGITLKFVRPGS